MDDIPKDAGNSDSEESSSSNSTATVFAWVAAILINGSFIVLVSWGTFSNWPIGFAFALLYSIVLLVVPYLFKRKNGGRDSILTSLLFLLAIVAIAVTGSYLPLNVFPCSEGGSLDDDYSYSTNGWVTETDNLPSNIQKWSEDGFPYDTLIPNVTSFVYFKNTGVTLFSGTDGSSFRKKLWRKIDGKAPEVVTEIDNPESFILAEETSTACFFFTDYLMQEGKLACTNDGVEISTTEESFNNPWELFYSNNLIWFLAYPPPESEGYGTLLYSADPSNLKEVKLYSSIAIEEEDKPRDNDECTPNRTNRVRFLSLLFLSAIPSFVAAVVIGFLYKIPSMPVGGYLSITWLVICLIFTIDPSFDNMDDFFRWWSVFTSGPWMIILTLAHLTKRMTKREISWGINFAGIVYTVGMFILLQVFSEDMFWRWALLTIFAILPPLVLAVITGQIILMIVASIVILIDVSRLTAYITEIIGFGESFPAQFIVLGLSGLALGFLGFLFSKRQSQFQSAVSAWTESTLGRWVYSGEGDGTGTGTGNNVEDENS